ncbi:hypothetical protein MHYP_G00284730 [Metynnis hypsauchen]
MGLGKCSRIIARYLYPLAFISMACNVLLFFPDWKITYVLDNHLTQEVKYMGGLIGGGVMIFLSIAFGVAGAIYSLKVAVDGLMNGPYCKVGSTWERLSFKDISLSDLSHDLWCKCSEPKNVMMFNVGLFGALVVVSSLEFVLCTFQTVIAVLRYMGRICSE